MTRQEILTYANQQVLEFFENKLDEKELMHRLMFYKKKYQEG